MTSSLSDLLSLSGDMVTICHMATVIGSRFWLTLHGGRNDRGREMTECASHVQWKMLLVKLSPRPKAEKMGTAAKF